MVCECVSLAIFVLENTLIGFRVCWINAITCRSYGEFKPHITAFFASSAETKLIATVGMKNDFTCLARTAHMRHLQRGDHGVVTHVISDRPANVPAVVLIACRAFVGMVFTLIQIRNFIGPDPVTE